MVNSTVDPGAMPRRRLPAPANGARRDLVRLGAPRTRNRGPVEELHRARQRRGGVRPRSMPAVVASARRTAPGARAPGPGRVARPDVLVLLRSDQGHDGPGVAGPPGAAGPVHVVHVVRRRVEVDHARQGVDVDAPGDDVRRHQGIGLPLGERIECPFPLPLGRSPCMGTARHRAPGAGGPPGRPRAWCRQKTKA